PFFSPSPLRGGGWGEGSSPHPVRRPPARRGSAPILLELPSTPFILKKCFCPRPTLCPRASPPGNDALEPRHETSRPPEYAAGPSPVVGPPRGRAPRGPTRVRPQAAREGLCQPRPGAPRKAPEGPAGGTGRRQAPPRARPRPRQPGPPEGPRGARQPVQQGQNGPGGVRRRQPQEPRGAADPR